MDFFQNERVALFIDGANLFATAKALDFDIDYRNLLSLFRQRANLVRALYYTTVVETDGPSTIRPLLDWLDYNGYGIVAKPVRSGHGHEEFRRARGSIHVEFTIGALALAKSVDHFVIFSGDKEYTALVVALQEAGNRVSIVSTLETQPAMVADDLRRAADQFIDLADLEPTIARNPASASANRPA